MKLKIGLSALLTIAATTSAFAWVGDTENGIHLARTTPDAGNEISVICDAGFNAPITSIYVMVEDQVPAPSSILFVQFDDEPPLYVKTDIEGAIASQTGVQARMFNQVVAGLKTSAKARLRLFDGSENTFDLSGSTDAIGTCIADFDKVQLAMN